MTEDEFVAAAAGSENTRVVEAAIVVDRQVMLNLTIDLLKQLKQQAGDAAESFMCRDLGFPSGGVRAGDVLLLRHEPHPVREGWERVIFLVAVSWDFKMGDWRGRLN